MPPYSRLTLLRVKARRLDQNIAFLQAVEKHAKSLVRSTRVRVHPPIAAIMEKKAGYYRAGMLFQAPQASDLTRYIAILIAKIETLSMSRTVNWHFDVDPLEVD